MYEREGSYADGLYPVEKQWLWGLFYLLLSFEGAFQHIFVFVGVSWDASKAVCRLVHAYADILLHYFSMFVNLTYYYYFIVQGCLFGRPYFTSRNGIGTKVEED